MYLTIIKQKYILIEVARGKRVSVVDVVREVLMKSDMSRYEISRLSGIDQAALSRFIHGGSLRVESLEKLCPILGLQLAVEKLRSTGRKGSQSKRRIVHPKQSGGKK